MNTHISEKEGVIKYDFEYTESPPLEFIELNELNAWRNILYLLNLIGQDPDRYDGYGYGNLSRRLNAKEKNAYSGEFVISGTQTGYLPELKNHHYVVITQCDPDQNKIKATGPIKPSSETLTHGAIYQARVDIKFVFHVHSPEIWKNARHLNIPETVESVEYGTPDMANEIKRLMSDTADTEDHIFCMKGHKDGVITFGKTAEEAGCTLVSYYSRALQV